MTHESIAAAILSAPGWARVGLTMPNAEMRERAAETIATTILDTLGAPIEDADRDQLALPL